MNARMWRRNVAEIDYRALAGKMRDQNEYPRLSMPVNEYHSAQAIYALIHAMEAMPTPCTEYIFVGVLRFSCALMAGHESEHESRNPQGEWLQRWTSPDARGGNDA